MSRAERSANMIRQAMYQLGEALGKDSPIGRRLLGGGKLSPEETKFIRQRVESAKRADSPSQISEKVRDAGGITMGQRSVKTRADLGAAPEPEFSVSAGNRMPESSPAIRNPQELREQIEKGISAQRLIRESAGSPKPENITATEYLVQRLGLRQPPGSEAIAEFTTSTGRIRPAGTKVGGQFYNPATMASEGNLDVIRRSGATTVADLDDLPDAPARISPGQKEMFIAPGEVRMKQGPEGPMFGPKMNVVDEMRPRGVQLIDFGKLSKQLASASPAEKAGILAALGLAGTVQAISDMPRGERPMTQKSRETTEAPVEPPIQPSAPAPAPAPVLSQAESGAVDNYFSEVLAAAQQTDPSSSSAIRALAPRSPENYGSLAEYNKARANFARALERGGRFNQMVEAAQARVNEADREGIAQFAKNFPQLVYADAVNRMGVEGALDLVAPEMNQPVAPEMSQQSDAITSLDYGSALGTNNEANAVGQANATASQMYAGEFNNDLEAAAAIQKNNELIAATAPMQYGNLQRAEDFLGQQLAARMAYRSGNYGIGGMG